LVDLVRKLKTTPTMQKISIQLNPSPQCSLFAPQVFTSLALFNVLILPLNAFPWVVNGIVEVRMPLFFTISTYCSEQIRQHNLVKFEV
jgi:hypothetical protein